MSLKKIFSRRPDNEGGFFRTAKRPVAKMIGLTSARRRGRDASKRIREKVDE